MMLPPLPANLWKYTVQGADRQIFSRMRHRDDAALRMPELMMTALGMDQLKAWGRLIALALVMI